MIKIICKKCNKEMCVSDSYTDNMDGLCADCLEKKNRILRYGPIVDEIPNTKILPYVSQCSKCNKIMISGNPPLEYKNKSYCKIHWEDIIENRETLCKCQKCNCETHKSFMKNYQGYMLCPHCFTIQQHDNILAASKTYCEKIASIKRIPLISVEKLSPIKKTEAN